MEKDTIFLLSLASPNRKPTVLTRMERYLLLDSKSEGEDNNLIVYELDSSTLLPHYFGSIAPVNVFLGENNSGKSRFMREIMKQELFRTIELNTNINEVISLLNDIVQITNNYKNTNFKNIQLVYQLDGSSTDKSWDIHPPIKRSDNSVNLKPNELLEEIIKLLTEAINTLKSKKELLDILTSSSYYEQLISDITDINTRLVRAAYIYKEMTSKGTLYNFYNSSGENIIYAPEGARITIEEE